MSGTADEVIRGYSPEVMKRLLGYIKPYKIAGMLTISALVLATAAELLLPIVMKLTLDDHLLRRENRLSVVSIEAAATGEGPLELTEKLAADLLKEGFRIGDSLFVPSQALSDLHSDERAAAVTAGWLDAENWYVVTNPDDDALMVINNHEDDFVRR